VNVLDATDNLVPKVVLKDMKGIRNAQRRPKHICFVMNHTQEGIGINTCVFED
jgi:hypothetical protein